MSCQYRCSFSLVLFLGFALSAASAHAQLADAGAPVSSAPPLPPEPPPARSPREVVPEPKSTNANAPALTQGPLTTPQQASAAPAAPTTQLVSMGPKGLTVQSPDARFSFNLRFPFMFDAKATLKDAQPKGGDAFFPRFFGPIFTVSLYKIVTGKLIVGFSDATAPSVNVVTAWMDVGPLPLLHLRLGKLLYPISLERQTLPLRIVMLEHGIASQLLPLTEFGAQLWGATENKVFEYQLTFGNGTPTNGRSETDLDDGKDVIGRVYFRPFAHTQNRALKGLGFGSGASYGRRQGSPTVPLTGTLRTLGGRPFFTTLADAANPAEGTVFAKGNVVRIVPQLAYTAGPVSVYGEYVRLIEELNKGTERRTLTHQSAHGVLSVALTGEDEVLLDILSPKRPLDLSKGQYGAFELTGNVEHVKLDKDTYPTFANPARSALSATAYGGGFNWIVNDLIRFMVNYEHTSFTAPAGTKKLRSENLLGARLQALF